MQMIEQIPAPPTRPMDGHKGTFGTVIVIGGSSAMFGAPAICARAAFRAGAGLVKIAAAEQLLPAVLGIEPCATGIVLDGPVRNRVDSVISSDLHDNAVLAVGPGLAGGKATRKFVQVLLNVDKPLVLDADGLNHLAKIGAALPECKAHAPRILTPHPGEFKRLAKPHNIDLSPTDPDQRVQAAAALAKVHQCVVLLKGQNAVVSDGERAFVNQTGNPCLATGGTGDVLTGMISSFLAQGLDSFDAACLGIHTHGLAADAWADKFGKAGLRAIELPDALPGILKHLRGEEH